MNFKRGLTKYFLFPVVFKAMKNMQWWGKLLCLCQETWERHLLKTGSDQCFVWRTKKPSA